MKNAPALTATYRAFRNVQLPLLYQELHDLTGYDVALSMNSGGEAKDQIGSAFEHIKHVLTNSQSSVSNPLVEKELVWQN